VTEPARIVFVAPNPSIDRFHEVERLAVGAIHRPAVVLAVPGGKGLNAARAAATLGGSVTAVAAIGGDAGAWIRHRLADLGVDARFVEIPGETRTCLSVLDGSTGELTEFYEAGPTVPAGALDDLVAAVRTVLDVRDAGAVAMSGSLLSGMPADGYARLVAVASERGAITILDTHGEALGLALAAHPSVVKVNADEAGAASGSIVTDPTSAIAAAGSLRDRGAGAVVVTLGAAGAVAHDATGSWHLSTDEPPGRYPVGSGDAFLGGLAVGLTGGGTLIEAARLGMAAGIANAATPGAGELSRDTADRLRPLIRVEVL
jgi:1-phosphofructokinase family hexose kinase